MNYLSAKEAKEKVEKVRVTNKEIYRIKRLIKFSALTGENYIIIPITLVNEYTAIIDHFRKCGFGVAKDSSNKVHIIWQKPSVTELDNERDLRKYSIALNNDLDIEMMTAKYAHTLYLKYTDNDSVFKQNMTQVFNKINKAIDDGYSGVAISSQEMILDNYILFILDYLGYKVQNNLNRTDCPFMTILWR